MLALGKTSGIGLDIADHTIEVVELSVSEDKFAVQSLSRLVFEDNVLERGRITNKERLRELIEEVFTKSKLKTIEGKDVVFALPESQVYTHTIILPPHSGGERDFLVRQQVPQNIPLDPEDILFTYQVINEGKEGVEVLIVATSKEVYTEWAEFFKEMNVAVSIYDIEPLALYRGLLRKAKTSTKPVCVVDMGARTSNVMVFDEHGLRYAHAIPVAGDVFTTVFEELGAVEDWAAAEAKKKEVGFDEKDKAVAPLLKKKIDEIIHEIDLAVSQYKKKTGNTVGEIILAGGSSQMKGLLEYLSGQTEISVSLGKPLVTLPSSVKKKYGGKLVFIESLGLAVRAIDSKKYRKEPAFYPMDHLGDGEETIKEKAIGLVSKIGRSRKEKTMVLSEEMDEFDSIELVTEVENPAQARPLVSETAQTKKVEKQKIMLVAILIIGIVAIGLLYWKRADDKAKKKAELEATLTQYTTTQTFEIRLPLATTEAESAADRVTGRIIRQTVAGAGGYDEAVLNSQIAADKELVEGERRWDVPLNAPKGAKLVYPFTFEWVVYNDKEANTLYETKINTINTNATPFSLNNIKKVGVETTGKENLLYLVGEVTIALNTPIEFTEPADGTIKVLTEE